MNLKVDINFVSDKVTLGAWERFPLCLASNVAEVVLPHWLLLALVGLVSPSCHTSTVQAVRLHGSSPRFASSVAHVAILVSCCLKVLVLFKSWERFPLVSACLTFDVL